MLLIQGDIVSFDFSQTYLYKMHRLTSSLDQAFDTALRRSADIGLSQFSLLLTVQQFHPVTQTAVANFLDISKPAVSRQVDLAIKNGWVKVVERDNDHRTQELRLTHEGKQKVQDGITVLENDVFDVFKDDNQQTDLMNHITTLQQNIDRLENNSN